MTTQELLKTNWKYLEAMRDGQVVQWKNSNGEWLDIGTLISLNSCIHNELPLRIKPKPIECWAAIDSIGIIATINSDKVRVSHWIGKCEHYRLVHLVEQPEEGEVGK